MLRTVAEHNPATPYFLFWAPHIVHTPLQVPDEFYKKFAFVAEDDNMVVYYKPKDFTHGAWSMANLLSKGSDFVDDVVKLSLEDEGRGKHPVLVYQLKQLGMKAGGNALLAMSAFSKR